MDFIPNPSLRRLYITSQIVRTLISKICTFFSLSYKTLYSSFKKSSDDLKIGIIGLGHIGSTILAELIRQQLVPIQNILVSTRCPERHSEYLDLGIQVFWDNEKLAAECDLIIIACLPHQLETVTSNIRAPLLSKSEGIFNFTEEESHPKTLVFSIVSGTPQLKLVQMIESYPIVIRLNLDVDMIGITIDHTGEDELPLNNCFELLHEIIESSVSYDDVVRVFNLAFKGQEVVTEEIHQFFYGDHQKPATRIREILEEYKLVN
jgi:hypothetical protein